MLSDVSDGIVNTVDMKTEGTGRTRLQRLWGRERSPGQICLSLWLQR